MHSIYQAYVTNPSAELRRIEPNWIYEANRDKIIQVIQSKFRMSRTTDHIRLFLKHMFLVDNNKINNNCLTYEQLSDYIRTRCINYENNQGISKVHINKMSFKFKGSIPNFDDVKSCGVCLEDFEKYQEICRLPCNHFFHKTCTEKAFDTLKPMEQKEFDVLYVMLTATSS